MTLVTIAVMPLQDFNSSRESMDWLCRGPRLWTQIEIVSPCKGKLPMRPHHPFSQFSRQHSRHPQAL